MCYNWNPNLNLQACYAYVDIVAWSLRLISEKILPVIDWEWNDRNGSYLLQLTTRKEGFPGGYKPNQQLICGSNVVPSLLIDLPGE